MYIMLNQIHLLSTTRSTCVSFAITHEIDLTFMSKYLCYKTVAYDLFWNGKIFFAKLREIYMVLLSDMDVYLY
jgi:hypothetical protein